MADMTPTVEPLAPQLGTPQVEPNAPQTPQTPPGDTQTPPNQETAALPEALIRIPAIQGMLAGAPPATSMPLKGAENHPEVKTIAQNKEPLIQAGFGFYKSLSGDLGVMFNSMFVHPDDIQAADQQGKLPILAPDFFKVNHAIATSGAEHPAFKIGSRPTAPAVAQAVAPPQALSGQLPLVPPASAAVGRKLAAQRILNLQPGAPTSGPSPGAGRLVNQVMKPVV